VLVIKIIVLSVLLETRNSVFNLPSLYVSSNNFQTPINLTPAGAGNFFLHHRVQTGSVDHPASYPMGTRGSLPGGKATGA
jgi:hypothetical protein